MPPHDLISKIAYIKPGSHKKNYWSHEELSEKERSPLHKHFGSLDFHHDHSKEEKRYGHDNYVSHTYKHKEASNIKHNTSGQDQSVVDKKLSSLGYAKISSNNLASGNPSDSHIKLTDKEHHTWEKGNNRLSVMKNFKNGISTIKHYELKRKTIKEDTVLNEDAFTAGLQKRKENVRKQVQMAIHAKQIQGMQKKAASRLKAMDQKQRMSEELIREERVKIQYQSTSGTWITVATPPNHPQTIREGMASVKKTYPKNKVRTIDVKGNVLDLHLEEVLDEAKIGKGNFYDSGEMHDHQHFIHPHLKELGFVHTDSEILPSHSHGKSVHHFFRHGRSYDEELPAHQQGADSFKTSHTLQNLGYEKCRTDHSKTGDTVTWKNKHGKDHIEVRHNAAGAVDSVCHSDHGKDHVTLKEESIKNLKEQSAEPTGTHIIMQLRKVVSLKGNHQVTFRNGMKLHISPNLASKAIQHHDSLKTADQKQEFSNKLHHSPAEFHRALAGAKSNITKVSKITLPSKVSPELSTLR